LKNNQFLYSGQFSEGNITIKVHSEGSLLTSDKDNFVTRIKISAREELDFTKPFIDAKWKFFEKLVITEILKDELLDKRDEAYHNFKQLLLNRSKKTTDNPGYAEDFLQLSVILETYRKLSAKYLLTGTIKNKYISIELKNAAEQLSNMEEDLYFRNKTFPKFDDFARTDKEFIRRTTKHL
jgi:hypothetical protein